MNHCLICNIETKNPKFCSSSCSAKYNNKNINKQEFFCSHCKTSIGLGYKFKNKKYCDICRPICTKNKDWSNVTIEQHFSKLSTYQAHARIRSLARAIYKKSNKQKYCSVCGYNKHYEVCHIKGIASFDRNTPIATVNDIDNLISLCPNCHWEFDNNILSLDDIKKSV